MTYLQEIQVSLARVGSNYSSFRFRFVVVVVVFFVGNFQAKYQDRIFLYILSILLYLYQDQACKIKILKSPKDFNFSPIFLDRDRYLFLNDFLGREYFKTTAKRRQVNRVFKHSQIFQACRKNPVIIRKYSSIFVSIRQLCEVSTRHRLIHSDKK